MVLVRPRFAVVNNRLGPYLLRMMVARRIRSAAAKALIACSCFVGLVMAAPPPKLPRPNPLCYVVAMAIDVSRPVEERFQARLRDGAYRSADELLDDALRLLEQREAFRQAVAHGLAQADRGELREGEEVFAELEADLDKSAPE